MPTRQGAAADQHDGDTDKGRANRRDNKGQQVSVAN